MILKLNFKVDEPTVNGHVYPREVFKKSIDNAMKKEFLIMSGWKDKISHAVGNVQGYTILENGSINIICNFLDTPKGRAVKDIIDGLTSESKPFELTTSGIGTLGKDKVVGDDFKLTHLFPAPHEEAKK